MPLQSSGQISLDDIHVEAGGSTGTEASLNDTDIRALISKADQTSNSFSEYYSASGASYSVTPSATSVMEGDSITVNFTAPESDGTTVYFLVSSLSGGLGVNDFANETGSISGIPYYEATVNNAAGSFTLTTEVDTDSTESENFQLQLRTGDVTGTVQATSSTITISNPTVSASDTTPNEGDTVTFTVAGRANHDYAWLMQAGGNYDQGDWAMTDGSSYGLGFGTLTTNSSGAASLQLDAVSDSLTEGNELYTFSIHPDNSISNTAVASVDVTIQDTSGSTVSITPSTTSPTEDGIADTFTIVGTPGTTYYITTNHITTSPADFLTGASGSITLTGSSGTWYVQHKADGTTEGSETYQLQLRTGSSTGTVVATSSTVTISDTSTNPSITEQSYYEMHLLNTLTGESSSWTTYTHSLSSYANTNGRLVFAYENGTSGTFYQGDIQVDNIRFTDTSAGQGYNYSFETSNNLTGWKTSTSNANAMNLGTSDADLRKFEDQLSNYADLATGGTNYRWNRDSGGTVSSGTGLTTGDDGDYYIYAETSGSSANSRYYTACSPLVDLDSSPGSVSYAVARDGGNIGTLKVYWAENKSSDPYTGGSTFTANGIALISRDTLNGSSSANTYFWEGIAGGYSSTVAATAYGNWPSGPSTGDTAKVCIIYKSRNYWRGDFQVDDFYVNATSETAGGTNTNIDVASTGWQRGPLRYTYTSTTWPNATTVRSWINSPGWVDITTGTANGNWLVDSGGTPSSGTGLTTVGSGNYAYFEASGSGAGYSYKILPIISREFTLNKSNENNGIRFKMGLRGTHFGWCQVYVVWE